MTYFNYPSPPPSPRSRGTMDLHFDGPSRKPPSGQDIRRDNSSYGSSAYPSPPLTDDDDNNNAYISPSRKGRQQGGGGQRAHAQSFSGASPPSGLSPAVQALTSIPLSRSKSAGMSSLLTSSTTASSSTTSVASAHLSRLSSANGSTHNSPQQHQAMQRRASVGASGAVRFANISQSSDRELLRYSEDGNSRSQREVGPIERTSTDRLTTDSQLEAKVVILGSQGVGKTTSAFEFSTYTQVCQRGIELSYVWCNAVVHRYTTGQFSNSLTSTIGASFLTKKIVMPECRVRLQLWDTAGQERFRSMAPIYYRGSQAAVIVYDITKLDSFYDVRLWLDELRHNMSSELIVHIVGAKSDLASQRAVTMDFARKSVKGWVTHASQAQAQLNSLQSGNSSTSTLERPPLPKPQASQSSSRSLGLAGLGALRASSRRNTEDATQHIEETLPPAWCEWDISEVSAKDDYGIEDLFLHITSRLVSRKVQIERERFARSRDSVMLNQTNNEAQANTGWACCT